MLRSLALAATFLSAACLHGPVRRPQLRPDWLSLESPHFSLRAQLPEREARDQLALLEGLYGSLAGQPAWAALRSLPRVNVIVVEDDSALAEFFGEQRETLTTDDAFGETLIVSSGRQAVASNRALLHAAAHVLDDAAFPALPDWLSEGLALRAESLRFSEGELVLPTSEETKVARLLRHRSADGSILLRERPVAPGEQRDAFDSWAWLFTQSLWAKEPKGLPVFLEHLARGASEAAAWQLAFPHTTFAQSVRALRLAAPEDSTSHVPLPPPAGAARRLYLGEVQALRATLLALAGRKEAARAEAALGLQGAPGDPEALAVLGQWSAAALERPRDTRAWVLYGDGAAGEARHAALRVAAALAPGSVGPLVRLAAEAIDEHDRSAPAYAAAAAGRGRTLAALDMLGRAQCAAGEGAAASRAWKEASLRALHADAALRTALGTHDPVACRPSLDRESRDEALLPGVPAPPKECRAAALAGGGPGVVFAQYRVDGEGTPRDLALAGDATREREVRAFLESCRFAPEARGDRVTAPFVFQAARASSPAGAP